MTAAVAPFPDPEEITFGDVIANRWNLTGSCEACRGLRPFRASLSPDLSRRRVGQTWREGKLICRDHRTPYEGIEIDNGGNMLIGFTTLARWFKPGHWPDPEYEARMRPIREENNRRLREQS